MKQYPKVAIGRVVGAAFPNHDQDSSYRYPTSYCIGL